MARSQNSNATAAQPGHCSLQLPYDRLKAPDTGWHGGRLAAEEAVRLESSAGDSREECVALAVAASAALFYRYSGQSVIPMSVCVSSAHALQSFGLMLPVRGAMTGDGLKTAARDESENPRAEADPDASVALDIRFSAEGPAGGTSTVVHAARPDITLEFFFAAASVSPGIRYNASLFEESTATRLLQHLCAAMRSVQGSGLTRISAIELFSGDERAWFGTQCVGAPLAYAGPFVHEEIARHAVTSADKTAVRFNDRQLTYAELNRRANQLARHLRARGIGGNERIVVCLEPSFDVAISLLAILKAGATYVPVNPAHPEFHIRAIAEDTRPALILTQSKIRQVINDLGIDVLELDNPPPELLAESTEEPQVRIDRRQIAYVYYTSGTTGRPKGVAASHENMIHFVNVARHRYRITADDVIPAVAAFTFSISMFELVSALSAGGTLVMLERQHVLSAGLMARTLREVTLFHIGPALLKNIVKYIKEDVADYRIFENVRHASSGGDMVPVELLRDMQRIFSASELYVIYGCSEISLMGCTWQLPRESAERSYVGKPLPNVHLLVLDDDDNQVPIGAVGDVCFGGPGVVQGYVNTELDTSALFFERDGVRFYRTGDRGRLNGDGQLELLGRRDFQIKLRGMRIELAEIDYHLRQAKGVRDGLVAVKSHRRGEPALVAYYVPESDARERLNDLHAHMAARLPDYMVPAFYVALDALPLNYNMKVDRKALPEPEIASVPARNPPGTVTEIAIARIWCELLHVDNVSLDDNFMVLGGDSLLAMEMISLVERQLDFRLDGMDVLRESLWILAKLVEHRTSADDIAGAEPLRVTRDILPVTSLYFGPDDSLYGLYRGAAGDTQAPPVLLCPPIGYENMRGQFMSRTLAERLSQAGVASLQFDFFGMADSLGEDVDATFERWHLDLQAALAYLKERSGSDRVRVFAMRLTALLALRSLPHRDVDRWVLWDPAFDGAAYYQQLSRMHSEKIDKLLLNRNLRRPKRVEGSEELVGTRYTVQTLETMKSLRLRDDDLSANMDLRRVLSGDFAADATVTEGMERFPALRVSVESHWYRSTHVTMAVNNKGVLDEIFQHLRDETL